MSLGSNPLRASLKALDAPKVYFHQICPFYPIIEASTRRILSPSTTPKSDAATPKKPKRLVTDDLDSMRSTTEAIENKLIDVTPTFSKKETFLPTSGGPCPGSSDNSADGVKDKTPPPWAQELWSFLKGIKDDIANVRADIIELQNRIPQKSIVS